MHICNHTGLVYEGLNGPNVPSVPTPSITQVRPIESELDWTDLPRGLWSDPLRWVFREDSFDPVAKMRRGRLYEPYAGQSQPVSQSVAPHPYEDPMMRSVGAGGQVVKTRYSFCACQTLLNKPMRYVFTEDQPAREAVELVANQREALAGTERTKLTLT